MLKRGLLLLRPADSPCLPSDSRRLCHPASPTLGALPRRGSGYRVSESLPESIPFNQQVHQVLSDAPPATPKSNTKPSLRRKTKQAPMPSRWSGTSSTRHSRQNTTCPKQDRRGTTTS